MTHTLRRWLRGAGVLGAVMLGAAVAVYQPWASGDVSRVSWEALAGAAETVQHSRRGLENVVAFMQSRPDLFVDERQWKKRALTREQREEIWGTWQSFLDHVLALDAVGLEYAEFQGVSDDALRKRAFKVAFAAFLAEYRFALDFVAITENEPSLHTVLNEPVPELGLPADTYAKVKFRFLNVLRGAEFARLTAVDRFYGESTDPKLEASIAADARAIWDAGKGTGPLLTAENGLQMIADAGFTAWFPVQKGVSQWMGDVKVLRPSRFVIQPAQIQAMLPRLEPGDVLLERREWYLSNIGLPGFWPHAALYVGTPEERRAYFDAPEIEAWLRGEPEQPQSFEALLEARAPEAYARSLEPPEEDHRARVLEAISEGVVFTSLEHSADADSVVVLRPRVSRTAKAKALLRAFLYSGRPYDFNFDFLTDAELVCTELVAKAYEPRDGEPGLRFPLVEIVGRQATPANEIARQFDANHGTSAQQLDFVLFLDGHEREGAAVESDLDTFRKSWRRPKWHILVQDTFLSGE